MAIPICRVPHIGWRGAAHTIPIHAGNSERRWSGLSKRSTILRTGISGFLLTALAALWLWYPQYRAGRPALAPAQLPDGPFVALTFDDGPRASTTSVLLDELSRRGVHATFFVIGENVAGNEDLLLRMEQEGHQIGLHTFHHRSLAQVNGADFYAEVDKLRESLSELLGREDFMLRPPFGMITPANRARAGAPIILWSVDPEDWSDTDSDRQTALILDNITDGGIILLHDIYPSSVETALRVVDELMAQGYRFVTVEELFALRGVTPENGTEYRRLPPAEE